MVELSFSSITNLGNNTGFNGFPKISASGNNVYLVWHDASHGIVFRRGTDGGTTFERAITLSATENNDTHTFAFTPHITSASGTSNVYVVWTNVFKNLNLKKGTESVTNSVVFRRRI